MKEIYWDVLVWCGVALLITSGLLFVAVCGGEAC